jgi:hypothetical protein
MKKLPIIAAVAGLAVVGGLSASAQSLMVQLQASNYNPTTGVWNDSVNSSFFGYAYAEGYGTGLNPTLTAGATPNGSAAVNFSPSHAGDFSLYNDTATTGAGISAANGYTIFAVIEPGAGSSPQALTGGWGNGCLEYRINGGSQDVLSEWTKDYASGTGTVPSTGFSIADVTVSSAGGTFYLNGVADGTIGANAGFNDAIRNLFNNAGGGEGFSGMVAEIDIYSGTMTAGQMAAEDSALTAEYITTVPEPSTWVMMASGFGMLLVTRRFRRNQG